MKPNDCFGISDELFIRGEVPMTKQEIRAISLSKLQVKETSHILDIGCGTGSMTVECGLIASKGQMMAIDQKEEAVRLTEQNIRKFQLTNVQTRCGHAPEALPEAMFDRIFLGGGSRQLEPIMSYVAKHLKPKGIFVANTILLESSYRLLQTLETLPFEKIECVQVQIARGGQQQVGWMMKALNPITIISATRR